MAYRKLRKIYCEDDDKVQTIFAEEVSNKVKKNEDIRMLIV